MLSIGAAAGAVASYFVTKRVTENRCFADYMASRDEKKKEEALKSNNSANNYTNDDKNGVNVDNYKPSVSSKDLVADRNASNNICFDNGYREKPEKMVKSGKEDVAPYLIDADDYASSSDYESEEIDWWVNGRFATTENGGDVLEELDSLVGKANIEEIYNSGETYGYVRNEKLKRDYVVHINHSIDVPEIYADDD